MGIEEIVIAAISAYLEREKAQQDQNRAMRIIQAINDTVSSNARIINKELKDFQLDTLIGFYLGLVENFKEYNSNDDQVELLRHIATESNTRIVGPLIQLYDSSNDVIFIRKVVRLLVLVLHLRALVLSELKLRHNDNREGNLLEQLKYAERCCNWVIRNQFNKYYSPALSNWTTCEVNATGVCIPTGDYDPAGGRRPTSCCIETYNLYVPERDKYQEDNSRRDKVAEAIDHLEGAFLHRNIKIK
ncbi:hypothetical protein OCA15_22655 [Bacillus cereus]|nr:hypothetical protein [Bacillus cereus]